MIARRHNHGAVAASIRRASRPCGGSTRVAVGVPEPSWWVGFRSRTDPTRGRRNFAAGRPSDEARALRGVGSVARATEPGGRRLRSPSGLPPPPAPRLRWTLSAAQTATNRPMTLTERRQVVGDAPLLTLRRQK
jgi:hypothetical protein